MSENVETIIEVDGVRMTKRVKSIRDKAFYFNLDTGIAMLYDMPTSIEVVKILQYKEQKTGKAYYKSDKYPNYFPHFNQALMYLYQYLVSQTSIPQEFITDIKAMSLVYLKCLEDIKSIAKQIENNIASKFTH